MSSPAAHDHPGGGRTTIIDISQSNDVFIEMSATGLPKIDGLHGPSTAPPAISSSGTLCTTSFWNNGNPLGIARTARLSVARKSHIPTSINPGMFRGLTGIWHKSRGAKHTLPPTDRPDNVYKVDASPRPSVTLHHCDPRLPCPAPIIVFDLRGPGAGEGTMCRLAQIQLGWTQLSAGHLFCAELVADGPKATLIREHRNRLPICPR